MKVILLADIKNVGKKNEIKEVSDGYARNQLIPKNLVVQANDFNIEKRKRIQLIDDENVEAEIKIANQLKDEIEKLNLILYLRTNNHLVQGVITSSAVIAELAKHNVVLTKKAFIEKVNFKTIGKKEIKCKLSHGVKAVLTITIEGK